MQSYSLSLSLSFFRQQFQRPVPRCPNISANELYELYVTQFNSLSLSRILGNSVSGQYSAAQTFQQLSYKNWTLRKVTLSLYFCLVF